jgi:hypothetical protein
VSDLSEQSCIRVQSVESISCESCENSIGCTNKTNDNKTLLTTVQIFLPHSGQLRGSGFQRRWENTSTICIHWERYLSICCSRRQKVKLHIFLSLRMPRVKSFYPLIITPETLTLLDGRNLSLAKDIRLFFFRGALSWNRLDYGLGDREIGVRFPWHSDLFWIPSSLIFRVLSLGTPLWSSGQSSWLQIQRSVFDSRHYQIFREVVVLEWGPLSLLSATEELLGRNSSGSSLKIREYNCGDPLRWKRGIFYPQ